MIHTKSVSQAKRVPMSHLPASALTQSKSDKKSPPNGV